MILPKAELLKIANDYARQKSIGPISESVLEDWINEDLLHGANAFGEKRGVSPTWGYPTSAVERAKLIIDLRASGAKRFSQLRLCLFVLCEGFHSSSLLNDLTAEFQRFVKLSRRKYTINFKPSDRNNLSRLLSRLPELDPDLKRAGFDWTPETIYEVWKWAVQEETNDPGPFVRLLKSLGLEFGGSFGIEEVEDRGFQLLQKANLHDLAQAKVDTSNLMASLKSYADLFTSSQAEAENPIAVAFRKASDSFSRPEWLFLTLAMFCIVRHGINAEVSVQTNGAIQLGDEMLK